MGTADLKIHQGVRLCRVCPCCIPGAAPCHLRIASHQTPNLLAETLPTSKLGADLSHRPQVSIDAVMVALAGWSLIPGR